MKEALLSDNMSFILHEAEVQLMPVLIFSM